MKTEIENYPSHKMVRIDALNNPDARLIMAKKLLEGHRWYLGFGNALGFHRDGDFIPEDTDIDLCITADDIDVKEIITKFSQCFNQIRQVTRGDQIHQFAFQDDDGLIIDLCFFYKGVSYCEGGKWVDDFNIREMDTKYGVFPFPDPIERYLTVRYGNWQVKSDDKAIKL